jgi:hypothetical protein
MDNEHGNRMRILQLFFAFAVAWPVPGWCDGSILHKIPAEQMEEGCDLEFRALPDGEPAIGQSNHSVNLRWMCESQIPRVIDNYEIEGSSPDIVTVFYRRRQDVIVLVKWSTNSWASDVQGDYYKIYVYRYTQKNPSKPFMPQLDIMRKLGEGWGSMIGKKQVHYPYKDAASIRSALDKLGY